MITEITYEKSAGAATISISVQFSQTRPSHWLMSIGLITLVGLIFYQGLGLATVAHATSRDEFPGRRQGGGTHWIIPE
ncbi:MAG: hypothetical protein HC922_00185 [Leptolyngbyaceae cyanobacterium SM2_3_12]|nr:hypothetical protein [Leptolyngbyaceae cyanobacterium SM2_3_12]